MRGFRHTARRPLKAGTLIVALVATMMLPGCGAAPATGGPLHVTPSATSSIPGIPHATPSATDGQSKVAPRVASQMLAEQRKVILADTSIDGPALWTSDPSAPNLRLASVLAWTGTNAAHSLNVLQSSDGLIYGGKIIFPESSNSRPAVAVQAPPTTIVLTWIGTDTNRSLNLLCQGLGCGTSGGGYKKVTFNDNSNFSPSLTQSGSRFLLAWTGTDVNHSLNILPFSLTTSGSGFQIGPKSILRQFSSVAGPSLALNPQNGRFMLSWAATTPPDQLAVATSSDGASWSNAQPLNEMSAHEPSGFAVATSSMPTYWMAWTGTDASHSVNVSFTQSLSQWPPSNKTTLTEEAYGGPALGYVGDVGHMLLAWTGTYPDTLHHLNIAILTDPAVPTLDQRIDAYIAGLSTTQLIGQTLMMSVCTATYNANLNQALTVWDVGSAIIYTSCNGGPTVPPTASGLQLLDQTMQSNANRTGSLLLALDEEGGTVGRLAPYYGPTPSARQLATTGNPQAAYTQAQTDAGRMRYLGLNVDFAPVVDVDQGGGVGPSRMFGASVSTVATYAGAFLDGLQQNSIAGTLKHWPGLGAATGNPDDVLPTIYSSQTRMDAIDFAAFRALLYQQPGMIMVTTVMAPAFDSQNPAILSPTLVTKVLRGHLGYQGVIVTDTLGAQGLIIYMQQQGYSDRTQAIAEASVRAFLAGDDLLLVPLGQNVLQAVVTAMKQAVQSGRISSAQLHAAVHRLIRLKVELGLIALP